MLLSTLQPKMKKKKKAEKKKPKESKESKESKPSKSKSGVSGDDVLSIQVCWLQCVSIFFILLYYVQS